MIELGGCEVWFLTGSQDLYGAETVERVERQSATVVALHGHADIPVAVRQRPVLTSADELDVIEPEQQMPRLPVARAVWEPRPSLSVAAEAWLSAGGPHHTCFTQAIDRQVLEDFAEIAGLELLAIGADTTPAAFRNELRWNQVYYHLAGGL